MIYLCIYSPVCSFWFGLVYSLLPGVSVHVSLALSCPALFVHIKDYYLSLSPRLRVPVSSLVCAPWQKTRPNRKRRPFTSVCFRFLKSFYLFLFICPAARKSPLLIPLVARVKGAWELGGIAASPLAASPHARRSREISAAGGGSPKPTGWLPSSRVAAPPGAPFAGDHVTGSPLTQCPPARGHCISARLWFDHRHNLSVPIYSHIALLRVWYCVYFI